MKSTFVIKIILFPIPFLTISPSTSGLMLEHSRIFQLIIKLNKIHPIVHFSLSQSACKSIGNNITMLLLMTLLYLTLSIAN